jgi:hypothetical protein
MGTWAADSFGNDSACDWIHSFLDEPGLPAIKRSIGAVINADDHIDCDTAQNCVAACEVIARLQGQWGIRNSYSEELDKWIAANPIAVPNNLKTAADSAIERILGEDSELAELWNEGLPDLAWRRAIEDLRRRIWG